MTKSSSHSAITVKIPTQTISKRNGKQAIFDENKILMAIRGAFYGSGVSKSLNGTFEQITNSLNKKVLKKIPKDIEPSVEQIQDMVEMMLLDEGYTEVAKHFILYRHKKREIRDEKLNILNLKELDDVSKKFDTNSLRVLASRYLFRNGKNEIIESPTQMFERVAILVAISDLLHDDKIFLLKPNNHDIWVDDHEIANSYLDKLDSFDYKFKIGDYYLNKYHFRGMVQLYSRLSLEHKIKIRFKEFLTMLISGKFNSYANQIKIYFDLMTQQIFLPNSPTMMNSGGRLGQLSACFVLGMNDDMKDIMKTTSDAALIFKSGGGVGINYSNLREKDDVVASTSGVASGPVSFMNIINTVTDVVKQGGKRRGANMGIMEAWHPDIEKFITNKTESGVLENFNISVGVWEDFWKALIDSKDGIFPLHSPHSNEIIKNINVHQLIDLIALSAWKSAEPGLIFFDQINKYNVFAKARGGPLKATNPCVTGDTLIYTDSGLRRVKDLYDNQTDFNVVVDGRKSIIPLHKSSRIFSSGEKDVYKLSTKEGYELRVTEDHKIMTECGWVHAKDLQLNDKIHLLNRSGCFGEQGNHDLGMVLGWLVADGTFNGGGACLAFFGKKRKLANKFAKMVNNLVPEGNRYRKQYTINVSEIPTRNESRVTSTRLKTLVNHYGINKENKLHVPEVIFNGTEESQSGFLNALFSADGTVSNCGSVKGTNISITSISSELLIGVQKLLSNFGIISRIYYNRSDEKIKQMPNHKGGMTGYKCKPCHDLRITKNNLLKFVKKIGFINIEKQNKLIEELKSYKKTPYSEKFVARFKSLVPDG